MSVRGKKWDPRSRKDVLHADEDGGDTGKQPQVEVWYSGGRRNFRILRSLTPDGPLKGEIQKPEYSSSKRVPRGQGPYSNLWSLGGKFNLKSSQLARGGTVDPKWVGCSKDSLQEEEVSKDILRRQERRDEKRVSIDGMNANKGQYRRAQKTRTSTKGWGGRSHYSYQGVQAREPLQDQRKDPIHLL